MPDKSVLGPTEWLFMAAVASLDGEAYGAAIYDKAVEISISSVSYGSLYPTLERLEAQGLLKSRTVEPPEGKGGRPRRYFELTGLGQKALKQTDLFSSRISGKLREVWGHS